MKIQGTALLVILILVSGIFYACSPVDPVSFVFDGGVKVFPLRARSQESSRVHSQPSHVVTGNSHNENAEDELFVSHNFELDDGFRPLTVKNPLAEFLSGRTYQADDFSSLTIDFELQPGTADPRNSTDHAMVDILQPITGSGRLLQIVLTWHRHHGDGSFHASSVETTLTVDKAGAFVCAFDLIANPFWSGMVTLHSLSVRGLHTADRVLYNSIKLMKCTDTNAALRRETRWKFGEDTRPVILMDSSSGLRLRALLRKPCSIHFGLGCSSQWVHAGAEHSVVRFTASARSGDDIPMISFDLPLTVTDEWRRWSFDLNQFSGRIVEFEWSIIPAQSSSDPQTAQADEERKGLTAILVTRPWLAEANSHREKASALLISLDTLRQDRLGCYGYPTNTSPWMDWFSRQATTWINAITPCPSTAPAHVSLFSGLLPFAHGVVFRHDRLAHSQTTLAEHLLHNGMITGAVTGGGNIGSYRNIDQGFIVYDDGEKLIASLESKLIPLLDSWQHIPFFIFYHTYEIHSPFPFREPLTRYYHENDYHGIARDFERYGVMDTSQFVKADIDYLNALYDSGIRITDAQLGRLFMWLRSRDTWESTAVCILSDHGEHLLESGLFGHNISLFEELVSIPLLVKSPIRNTGPELTFSPISLIDVPGLLCTLLGKPPLIQFADTRGFHVPPGNVPTGSLFSELKRQSYAIRDGHYKWIFSHDQSGDAMLFSLPTREKPEENIVREKPELNDYFHRLLDRLMTRESELPVTAVPPGQQIMDEKTRRELEQLGYIDS